MDYQSDQNSEFEKSGLTTEMIGYIDKLGIFRWDVDPDNKNGYLEEKIVGNDNLFQILVNKNEVKAWKKDITFAYDIISGIYRSLIHKSSNLKGKSRFRINHMKSYPDFEVSSFNLLLIDQR